MNRHRKIYLLCIPLFLSLVLIGGTTAYLTAFDQKQNRMAVGCNTTTIQENFPNPGTVTVRGDPTCRKQVWVTNSGGGEKGYLVDCYVRVALLYSDWDIGQAVTLLNLNTTDWVYGEDGYYYYRYVLKKNQSTSPLFDGFTIHSSQVEKSRRQCLKQFTITVYEESVQAEGFENAGDAWQHYAGYRIL